jgi:hypothetical protein
MVRIPFKILLAFTALVLLIGIAYAQETSLGQEYYDYQSPGKMFRCILPNGWSVHEVPDHSREVTKVDGVNTYRGNFRDRVTLSVYYFPEGNKLHKSMERYIAVHSRPVLGAKLEGEDYEPVSDMELKVGTGKRFQRSIIEYEDHVFIPKLGKYVEPLHPKQVSLTETFIVMPAGSGFVAFRYKATPQDAKANEHIFSRVVDSFTLLIH